MRLRYSIPLQKNEVKQSEKIQNKALRSIFNIKSQISFSELRREVGVESLQDRRLNARLWLCNRYIYKSLFEPLFAGRIVLRRKIQ